MIWAIRIVAVVLIIFFAGPAIYFITIGDWAYVVMNVGVLSMIVGWWVWLEGS